MKALLTDTGYLIALYGPGDDYHRVEKARESFRMIFEQSQNVLVLTWPVLYETLNTKLSKCMDVVERIENEWRKLRSRNQLLFSTISRFAKSRSPSGKMKSGGPAIIDL